MTQTNLHRAVRDLLRERGVAMSAAEISAALAHIPGVSVSVVISACGCLVERLDAERVPSRVKGRRVVMWICSDEGERMRAAEDHRLEAGATVNERSDSDG